MGGRRDEGFDGVRVTARRRGRRTAVALGLLALAVVAGVAVWRNGGRSGAPDGERAVAGGASPPGHLAARAAPPRTVGAIAAGAGTDPPPPPRDGEDPTLDLSDYVLPGEAPTMAQVIDALHARGIRTGLGAFPPPGTSPPLEGLEVPDGFALPEGYVRHHQATDDGQRIAPILMFAPDIEAITVHGVRIPVPADRVVPPALAPPGMALRPVRIPPPRDAGGHR